MSLHEDPVNGLNKRILEVLRESYSTAWLDNAISELDKIRTLLEPDEEYGEASLRGDFIKLRHGAAYHMTAFST